MTAFVDAKGLLIGETADYVPAGGVVVTNVPAQSSLVSAGTTSSASATSDTTGSQFNITLDFSYGGLTASQQSIFTSAAARWESIITGDLPDISGIDDVKIYASGKVIDGVGTILGQSGYTAVRSDSQLPYMGTMTFDSADLASMESNNQLLDVITHEMGHVLGIGSLWARKGLIQNAGTAASSYTGANAIAEYGKFIGNNSVGSIPLETNGGAGTADAHWSDATFGSELMTGYLSGTNQLSRMSAASLIDLGYPSVNVDAADLYTMSNALPTVGTLAATSVGLGSSLPLTLSSASDNTAVSVVNFYRESNGIPGLQSTGTVTSDTLVGTVNGGGNNLGVQAVTAGLSVGTYTYYARATDQFGALSAVAATTASILNLGLPATPAAPDLADASDTGDSSTDNVTAVRQPTFAGTATAAATVTLWVDGNAVGTATADASGRYSIAPAAALSDGSHAVAVTATTVLGTSTTSAALPVTIDSTGGSIVSLTYDRERTQQIAVKFDDASLASRLAANGVSLVDQSSGIATPLRVASVDAANGIAYLGAVSGALFADGHYSLSIPTTAALDLAGNRLAAAGTLTFNQLAGDANGDNVVDFNDLLLLGRNYGTAGKSTSGGNVDYSADGAVTFSDLLILAKSYGSAVTPAGAVQYAAFSSSSSLIASVLDGTATAANTSFTATGHGHRGWSKRALTA